MPLTVRSTPNGAVVPVTVRIARNSLGGGAQVLLLLLQFLLYALATCGLCRFCSTNATAIVATVVTANVVTDVTANVVTHVTPNIATSVTPNMASSVTANVPAENIPLFGGAQIRILKLEVGREGMESAIRLLANSGQWQRSVAVLRGLPSDGSGHVSGETLEALFLGLSRERQGRAALDLLTVMPGLPALCIGKFNKGFGNVWFACRSLGTGKS